MQYTRLCTRLHHILQLVYKCTKSASCCIEFWSSSRLPYGKRGCKVRCFCICTLYFSRKKCICTSVFFVLWEQAYCAPGAEMRWERPSVFVIFDLYLYFCVCICINICICICICTLGVGLLCSACRDEVWEPEAIGSEYHVTPMHSIPSCIKVCICHLYLDYCICIYLFVFV